MLCHSVHEVYNDCGHPRGYGVGLILYMVTHIMLFSNFYNKAYAVGTQTLRTLSPRGKKAQSPSRQDNGEHRKTDWYANYCPIHISHYFTHSVQVVCFSHTTYFNLTYTTTVVLCAISVTWINNRPFWIFFVFYLWDVKYNKIYSSPPAGLPLPNPPPNPPLCNRIWTKIISKWKAK